jgi:hypothetical protein
LSMHHGSCHCGAVRFQIDWAITELTTCDCSLCVKRHAVMTKVPETALTILSGEAQLGLYQWNTHRAQHHFCKTCGIYVFHRKRAAPDHFGVNIFCLENFDHTSVPVIATEGANMTIVDLDPRPEWPGPRVASPKDRQK